MNLNKLYKMQAELDKHILEKHDIKMSKEELLDNTILALLVEVGELANTTRCFKHWSTKGMMEREIVLDELADVWHFYLSIGNQKNIKLDKCNVDMTKHRQQATKIFISVYFWILRLREFPDNEVNYIQIGWTLNHLAYKLSFTDKEVEQAYLKKHEENYRRQREGY